ncbi:MAG: RNA polymerase sigma factor [Acetatifactor sp.]|nr:RNA polymerase sigma factor [Acetatifactor sp.]
MKFAAAYEQSRDAVYGYLMYMTRDAELAEDLSQEVFLRMFLHLGKFREESSVRTWALTIARNVFLSYAKRKRPILLQEQGWEPMSDINSNQPEEEALKKEQAEKVHRCLMCLTEQERTVLLLRDFEELSYEEIAKVMGLKAEVVKSRIHRARQKFREIYKKAEND